MTERPHPHTPSLPGCPAVPPTLTRRPRVCRITWQPLARVCVLASMLLGEEPLLNLAVGHPSTSLLPHAVLAGACEAAGARLRTGSFQLGYGRTSGEAPVTEALACWLTAHAPGEAPVRHDRLFITSGVSHGLDLVCACLSRPGDLVLLTTPCYFLSVGIFTSHGLRLQSVASDHNGLDVAALTALLQSGVRPRLLYLCPSHANPSACTLPAASRAALVGLAREYVFFVLADEVYHHLSWDAALPPRMRHWDLLGCSNIDYGVFDGDVSPLAVATSVEGNTLVPDKGWNVVALSSFSKILAPGLRLGWIEAGAPVLSALAKRAVLISGGGVAPFSSLVVLEAMRTGGLDAHLGMLLSTYKRRCATLCAALRSEQATTGWEVQRQPTGGYFVWLRTPQDVPAQALVEAAAQRGVTVLDGARCCAAALPQSQAALELGSVADVRHRVRLCFAHLEERELQEGVRRLAHAVEDVRRLAIPSSQDKSSIYLSI